jgi:hypothetical protein
MKKKTPILFGFVFYYLYLCNINLKQWIAKEDSFLNGNDKI